jgi:hypothetical protein
MSLFGVVGIITRSAVLKTCVDFMNPMILRAERMSSAGTIMKKLLVGVLTVGSALTGSAALAGQADNTLARLEALEKENAAIRRENAALRDNKVLRERNANLKSAVGEPQIARAMPASPPAAGTRRDPFGAYAADLPGIFKAPPREAPGQLRFWGEGGATWSGGDPVFQNFQLTDFAASAPGLGGFSVIPGQFDLAPKLGGEAATGFDYRFPGSRWHVNGQFRYGESGKASGVASSGGAFDPLILDLAGFAPGTTGSGNQTFTASYKEKSWLADVGVGYEVAGHGRSAMQVKGGLRVQESNSLATTSDTTFTFLNFAAPFEPLPGVFINSLNLTQSTVIDTRTSFLGAGPRIGIEGSVPFAGSWAFDYLGDLAVLFGTQKSIATTRRSAVSSVPLLGGDNSIFTNTSQRFATMLGADIQVGISYWINQNVKVGASYRLDALINVQNTEGAGVSVLTPDRYTHGPRLTVTGQFDSL